MAVAGRGEPDLAAVLEVARAAGVPARRARGIVEEVSAAVLEGWPEVAPSMASRQRIAKLLRPLSPRGEPTDS
jgi:hypothetical protein